MTTCNLFEEELTRYLGGDLSDEDLARLRRHCQSCPECREIAELHLELPEVSSSLQEASGSEFQEMREAVLARIARGTSGGLDGNGWRRNVLPILLHPIGAVAVAVLLLAGGVLMGRNWLSPTGFEPGLMVREIQQDAASHRRLADLGDSRYTYSNVVFRKVGDDSLELGFDVATHVKLVQPVDSPLVKEILVHSLLNPSHVGSRLKAISYAEKLPDRKVKEALIYALQNDANLAVRLKALSILSGFPKDPEITTALLKSLKDEDSVQVRLQALDYLADRKVDPRLIWDTIRQLGSDTDSAVLLRAAEFEQ